MGDLQIGTVHEFPAASLQSRVLCTVVSDGANTVTVDDVTKLELNMIVDIATKTTGAVTASARTITAIDILNKIVTYSGADVTATTLMGLVLSGLDISASPPPNINGGGSVRSGFFDSDLLTIESMRQRLTVINGTYYTAAVLNMMTMNDMLYAIRVSDYPTTIKQ